MPNGRRRPSAFGMYRRSTGAGQYCPALRSRWISSRNAATPRCSMAAIVSPSTPAAPCFARTRLHASHRTSPLWIRSYSAWNRRPRCCLAARHSVRWSSRTLSTGRWSLRSCPRAYPQAHARSKQGPFPPGGCLAALPRYFAPLGLPPDAAPFRTRLIDAALLQREPPGKASPVPHRAVGHVPLPVPRRSPALLRWLHAVCCLRRGMPGSASSAFRLIVCRGGRIHVMLRPAPSLPP